MASRILGMGDIVSLVEKAQHQFDEEEAKKLEQKFRRNQFTLDDFHQQLLQIKQMGSIRDLLGMLPGMDRALKGVDVDEKAMSRLEAILTSMTKQERNKPEIINGSRRRRIAAGSGTKVEEVNRLLKQFDEMRKMMRQLTSGKGGNMRAQLARGMGLPGMRGRQ
jgi:signal recognition particle subunit SRP54